MEDAKFGIYAHSGVYTVPAWGNEWYPRNMYRSNQPEFQHHRENWGDQATFGYKDFIPMFKAERWDPAAWASLYKSAGARYAGPVAEHHDGFSLWDSQVNRWNSVRMGPKRDIVRELTTAIRAEGLQVFISLHHDYNVLYGTSPNGCFPKVPGTDTVDPAYRDFYGNFGSAVEAYDPRAPGDLHAHRSLPPADRRSHPRLCRQPAGRRPTPGSEAVDRAGR